MNRLIESAGDFRVLFSEYDHEQGQCNDQARKFTDCHRHSREWLVKLPAGIDVSPSFHRWPPSSAVLAKGFQHGKAKNMGHCAFVERPVAPFAICCLCIAPKLWPILRKLAPVSAPRACGGRAANRPLMISNATLTVSTWAVLSTPESLQSGRKPCKLGRHALKSASLGRLKWGGVGGGAKSS